MKIKYQQSGFSLIEVLITVVILATGLLSITGLQLNSVKASHNALMKTQARYIATTLLDKIRANPQALSDYLVDGATFTCPVSAPTPTCVSVATSTTACTATQLATSEKHLAICGHTVSGVVNGGVKNELPSASMTIQCIKTDGTFSSTATDCATRNVGISISWGERNLNSGAITSNSLRITGSI
ncbi:MAG: type IV pilus modification protein PilV [Thiotrichaceae bacterium]